MIRLGKVAIIPDRDDDALAWVLWVILLPVILAHALTEWLLDSASEWLS